MLKIDGKEYDTKFNYGFASRLTKDYSTKQEDGFNRLIGQLVDKNPDGLVHGYRYALDCPTKELPSVDKVAEALDKAGIFDKGETAFADFYKQLKSSGFLAMKIKQYTNSVKNLSSITKSVLPKIKDKDEKQSLQVQLVEAKEAFRILEDNIKQFSK